MLDDEFEYDVFLSHSSRDKDVVRPLAERLREDGVKVWLDEWVIKPAKHIPTAVEEGLKCSRVLVLCASKHGFGSDWVSLELGQFRMRDPLNKLGRYLAVRLDDAEIDGTLGQFRYIDLQPARLEQGYSLLRETIRPGEPSERGGQTKRPFQREIPPEKPSWPDVRADLERLVSFIDRELEIVKVNEFLEAAVVRQRPVVVVVCGDLKQEHGRFCERFQDSRAEGLRKLTRCLATKQLQVNFKVCGTEDDTYAVLREKLFEEIRGQHMENNMASFVRTLAQQFVVIEFSLGCDHLRHEQLPRVLSRLAAEMELHLEELGPRRATVVLWVNYSHPPQATLWQRLFSKGDEYWRDEAESLRDEIHRQLSESPAARTFRVDLGRVRRGDALDWVRGLRNPESIRQSGQQPCPLIRLLTRVDWLSQRIEELVPENGELAMKDLVDAVKDAGKAAMADWGIPTT